MRFPRGCSGTPTAPSGCRHFDAGAPVSIYTVARELGHRSDETVRRVYAHLGTTRHRSDVVEYRVAQSLHNLGDRLRTLEFVVGTLLAERRCSKKNPPLRPKSQRGMKFQSGPGAIRTRDLLLRRQALYPTELRTRDGR